ncbi:MAG TPA: hypothetical protein VLA72_16965 [Anaerolineales bacterium]|nr:hypothetical protein [Anaerolineales bacterium]
MVDAAFLTEEVSVDQVILRNRLKKKIFGSPSINPLLGHEVIEILTLQGGFQIVCRDKNGSRTISKSDIVFNCLWESRTYFDKLMGINDEPPHSIRIHWDDNKSK